MIQRHCCMWCDVSAIAWRTTKRVAYNKIKTYITHFAYWTMHCNTKKRPELHCINLRPFDSYAPGFHLHCGNVEHKRWSSTKRIAFILFIGYVWRVLCAMGELWVLLGGLWFGRQHCCQSYGIYYFMHKAVPFCLLHSFTNRKKNNRSDHKI